MTTLVTGASGFLGTHLVGQLRENGEKVRALVKPGTVVTSLLLEEAEVVEADIRNSGAVLSAVRGCSQIFHLAACAYLGAPSAEHYHGVNVGGTRNVLQAARAMHCGRLVFTSTCSFLGLDQRAAKRAADETGFPKSPPRIGPYSQSKHAAEKLVIEAGDLDTVIVCPTVPLGEHDRTPTPFGRLLLDHLAGRVPVYLNRSLNFVDARDCARGHILALEKGRRGERYVLGGENLMLSQVFEKIADLGGPRAPRRTIPYLLALASAWALESWARSTGCPPRATVEGVRMVKHSFCFSSAKARRELGYHPRPVGDALALALRWHLERRSPVPLASSARRC